MYSNNDANIKIKIGIHKYTRMFLMIKTKKYRYLELEKYKDMYSKVFLYIYF